MEGASIRQFLKLNGKLFFHAPYRFLLTLLLVVGEKVVATSVPLIFSTIVAVWLTGPQLDVAALILVYAASTSIAVFISEFRLLTFLPGVQNLQRDMVWNALRGLHASSKSFKASDSTTEVSRLISRAAWSLDNYCSIGLFNLLPTIVQFILALFALAFLQDVVLALILVITMVIYFAYTVRSVRTQKTLYASRLDHDGRVLHDIGDSFLNHETVVSYRGESEEKRRLEENYATLLDVWSRQQKHLSYSKGLQSVIIQLGLMSVLLTLYFLSSGGMTQTSDLVMVNMYVIQAFLPMQSIGLLYTAFVQALTDLDNLDKRLSPNDIEEERQVDGEPIPVRTGDLFVEKLTVVGDSGKTLVSGSFQLPVGKVIMVTGPSGSGKSSLLRALSGLNDATGQITIGTESASLKDLAASSLYIGQIPGLFNQSIDYNVGYPSVNSPPEKIRDVISKAGLSDLISEKAGGIDAMVGEQGQNLSGGERQRVAIARALHSPRDFMMFDESTSNLDAVSERTVLDNIKSHLSGRTLIFVSHRLELFRDADHILYVENNQITAAGTHEQLLGANKGYADIWKQRQRELIENE